jgi:pyruvate,water dikinase
MENDRIILSSSTDCAVTVNQAGGKGFSLWQLKKEGFPVPPFIILSADYYRKENGKSLSKEIGEKILEAIDRDLSAYTLFSVRSSSVMEDGSELSFAGQFKSLLNVKKEDVISAERDVWNSANTETVQSYLDHNSGANSNVGMAVVIQAMIPSEISGVAFAIDPVTGNRNAKRISAIKGLGEQLVSGEVDACEYVIESGEITFIQNGSSQKKSVLSDDQLREIAELVDATTTFFGLYQDIEWAIASNKLYLLQSRPITHLADLPDEKDELIIWDNSNITESYPGMTTPLTFSFIEDIYREVYKQFCRVLGVEESLIIRNEKIFSMLGHLKFRVYYNLGNWYRVLHLLPGYEINAGFMEQMMGVKEQLPIKVKTIPSKQNKYFRLMRMITHILSQWMSIEKSTKTFYEKFQKALDAVPAESLKNKAPTHLREAYEELEKRLITKWDTPLVNDFFAMVAFGIVVKQLESIQIENPKAKANSLLADEGGIISTEPSRELEHIAEEIKKNESLKEQFLSTENVSECLKIIYADDKISPLFKRYIDQFGDRWAEELKLETITPTHEPELLIPMIKMYLTADITRKSGTLQDERKETLKEVNNLMGFFSPKKIVFNLMLSQARKRVKGRENLRYERTRLFAKIREIFIEWGKYYYRNGLLQSHRDIFFLTKSELFKFSSGTLSDLSLQALVDKRKMEWEEAKKLNLPERIQSFGNPNTFNQIKEQEFSIVDGDLSGIGCSKGVVKGKVRIVHSPSDIEGLSGCIMVAEKTDPGWTPIFPLAKAILVERGSLLSHAAIVAREMGIPAIVSIPNVMNILKNDMWIQMDGSTGLISVLDQEEDHHE